MSIPDIKRRKFNSKKLSNYSNNLNNSNNLNFKKSPIEKDDDFMDIDKYLNFSDEKEDEKEDKKEKDTISLNNINEIDKNIYKSYDEIKKEKDDINVIISDIEKKTECDLIKILNNIKIKKKNSVSDTIIIEGQYKTAVNDKIYNLIIKQSQNPLKNFNTLNGLEVERQVYKNIIKELVQNNNCIFLVYYVGNYDCINNFTIDNNKENIEEYKNQLDNINNNNNYIDFDHTLKPSYSNTKKLLITYKKDNFISLDNLLFNQIPSSEKIRELIENNSLKYLKLEITLKDIIDIFFQLLYTLECFNRYNMRHNDLHFGNILIEKREKNNPLTFFINMKEDKYIKITTNYIVKIYDYDRAMVYNENIDRNLFLDRGYCFNYGTCNKINKKYDIFTIFANLYRFLLYSNSINTTYFDEFRDNVKKFIYLVINREYFLTNYIVENKVNWLLKYNDEIYEDNIRGTVESIEHIYNFYKDSYELYEINNNEKEKMKEQILIFDYPPQQDIPLKELDLNKIKNNLQNYINNEVIQYFNKNLIIYYNKFTEFYNNILLKNYYFLKEWTNEINIINLTKKESEMYIFKNSGESIIRNENFICFKKILKLEVEYNTYIAIFKLMMYPQFHNVIKYLPSYFSFLFGSSDLDIYVFIQYMYYYIINTILYDKNKIFINDECKNLKIFTKKMFILNN